MIRLAVTTDARQAPRVGELAREAGLEPVFLPTVRIEPSPPSVLAAARRDAGAAELLVVTSARVLDVLWPTGDLPDVPFLAVGPRTAAAIVGRGGRVRYVGTGGARELVEGVAEIVRGRRVCHPRARGAAPEVVARLGERAAGLRAPVVYATVPIAPGADPVDAVVFGSPSAVRGWTTSRGLSDVVVGVIGPRTETEVRRHGRRPDVVAPRPGFAELVLAVAAHLEVTA